MDFNNTGAMRSPFSPRVRQSITGRRPISLSTTKKSQSKYMQSANDQAGDIIYKTPLITLETHGLPLPVMVTEALTFGSGDVSVRMSECGWCWVVTGRRILTWPHLLSPDENGAPLPAGSMAARELTLPQTDLAHKADLVMVFYSKDAQMPSCVGVSPEGVVRCWGSVGQEGAYSDSACELAGQEAERLVWARGALLLATTTCTLVHLTPHTTEGRATVSCRTLRPPSGWLGGIGRRVSHMFFGSMPANAEPRLVGVVGVGGDAEQPHVALVAGGPVLQVWRGAELHEHSLRRALADEHLLAPHGEAGGAELAALDVRALGEDLLLLLAPAATRPHERRYAIAHISIADPARPVVRAVAALRGAGAEAEEPPRFLPLDAHVLLYTHDYIALASSAGSSDKVEYILVSAEGDRVLGAEVCGGAPLLFTRKHGVLLLTVAEQRPRAPSACDSPMGSPCPSDMYDGNLSFFEIDPHEISTVTTDACGKLKSAFLFHVRRETGACRALLQELFPRDEAGDVDGVLARTVLAVAAALVDDAPADDPRWKARGGAETDIALGSSAALQVAAQLQDKRRALALFRDFLHATALLQRAGAVTAEGGGAVSAEAALAALAERLAAAIALRAAHQAPGPHKHLIDAAIEQVVSSHAEEEEPETRRALAAGALSAADVCYRRVSRAPLVLAALARAPAPHHPPAAAADHALATVTLLTNILSEVHKCRSQWGAVSPPALGPRALLPALLELVRRAVTREARAAGAGRAALLEAAAALAAAALHDAAPLRDHPRTAHIYERMRRDAILPFLEEGQTERAAALADKFQDFELLVQLCVRADDMERLHRYIDKYEAQGMAETAYSWLASQGGACAARLVRMRGGARLAAWLRAAPARAPLAALRHLAAAEPAAAAALFADMADTETDSLDRMTTAASLAKLCAVAGAEGEGEEAAARAEARLALAEHHAALPRDLRDHYGLRGDCRVHAPEELVQMYIESESGSLTEYDYKKALDLTDRVRDMEHRDDLRLRVWCACIRRDRWAESGGEAPLEALHSKMFFRLIDLVHVMGGDLELVLPPLEDILTAPELAELVSAPAAHYALRCGLETLAAARRCAAR